MREYTWRTNGPPRTTAGVICQLTSRHIHCDFAWPRVNITRRNLRLSDTSKFRNYSTSLLDITFALRIALRLFISHSDGHSDNEKRIKSCQGKGYFAKVSINLNTYWKILLFDHQNNNYVSQAMLYKVLIFSSLS